jgi:energy-coupling factor transporter ATP-binding protein EcfA2
MLYRLVIENPEATPVPHWEKVKFLSQPGVIEFKPGLNVVFGQNGTGKSTLINGLARLMHCQDENWPLVTRASVSHFLRFPGIIADGLVLEHDGSPGRYLGIHPAATVPERGVERVNIAMSENRSISKRASSQMSSGQASVTKLIRFLRHDATKVRYSAKSNTIGAQLQPVWEVAVRAIKNGKPQAGMPKQQVILLDEVDHNLDFAHQALVWKTLRALIADGQHQVIIASHSPFAVNVPGAHYIETTPGYLAAARAALSLLHEEEESE